MTKIIKVLYSTNYHRADHRVPKIQMEGRWLEELGFSAGDMVAVDYADGEIRIRQLTDIERAAMEQREMEAAIQRHKAELAAITEEQNRLARVAEASSRYADSSVRV